MSFKKLNVYILKTEIKTDMFGDLPISKNQFIKNGEDPNKDLLVLPIVNNFVCT
jgi:hypothetical protein